MKSDGQQKDDYMITFFWYCRYLQLLGLPLYVFVLLILCRTIHGGM